MRTLTVMNEKGGVGKTTIAAHAAWYFAEKYRTLVLDLDQQGNLTTTLGAYVGTTESVRLFTEVTRVPPSGHLTATRSTRTLQEVEGADRSCIVTFRDSLVAMSDDYDICIIDTPPALTNRTYGALLASDAVIAPIGINDYSIQGVAELLRAIRGVSTFYKRAEPKFLGLLPSIYDSKSPRERAMIESLIEQVGKLVFPAVVTKRDAYATAATTGEPVWHARTRGARDAGREIRQVLEIVAQRMELV